MKKFFLQTLAFFAIFVSCNKAVEQPPLPELSVFPTTMQIGKNGATETITVYTNRSFSIICDADWLAFDPEKIERNPGEVGEYTVDVTAHPTNEGSVRTATFSVKTATHHADVTVTQDANLDLMPIKIYYNNFDKEQSSNNPFLNTSNCWRNEEGAGVTEALTYYGGYVSARTTSGSSGNSALSGVNNLLFGTNGVLVVAKIALHKDHKSLILSFGTWKYEEYVKAEFPVMVSTDGTKWASVDYTFESGALPASNTWEVATAQFTLPEPAEYLYIRFAPTVSSSYRIDDLRVQASETQVGNVIDWSKATEIALPKDEITPVSE